MSPFAIFTIVLTLAYVIYYGVMISRDLTKNPGQEEAQEELDLVARIVCQRTQDRHEQSDDQGGHGLGVGPRGHQLGRSPMSLV